MSLQCPFGVDKKHVPAILMIWEIEYNIAYVTTSKPVITKAADIMIDIRKPTTEHAIHPIILVL